MSDMTTRPPRDDLYRAAMPSDGETVTFVELRASSELGMPTMHGFFSRFNQWTEIRSRFEGNFLERVAPGAFKRTFNNNREAMRALFQHGKDPQIGDKPLGPITELREEGDIGAYYEVPLLDTAYNREIIPGLEAGLYGASFRFSVVVDDYDPTPGESAHNPSGLPERTVKEAKVMEFGPVTFPAYAGATAGVRSITDLVHDVDAMTAATPILLDDERLAHARAFITRTTPTIVGGDSSQPDGSETTETESHPAARDDHDEAPPQRDAPERSYLAGGARESGWSHLVTPKREGKSNLL
jgi:HK97 family phage prohead protease